MRATVRRGDSHVLPLAAAGVALAAVFLCVALVMTFGAVGQGSVAPHAPPDAGVQAEEAWGISILRVSLTAGGGLVELKYQVVDEQMAEAALGPSAHGGHNSADLASVLTQPILIEDDSQQAVTEARMHLGGRVQQQRLDPKLGVQRNILFKNTGGLIDRGDEVTLAIGQTRVSGLVAQ